MLHTYPPHPEEHPEGVRLEGRTSPMRLFVMLLLALSASLAIAAAGAAAADTQRRLYAVSQAAEDRGAVSAVYIDGLPFVRAGGNGEHDKGHQSLHVA